MWLGRLQLISPSPNSAAVDEATMQTMAILESVAEASMRGSAPEQKLKVRAVTSFTSPLLSLDES
jgi:hypothetical protein